jgi:hypothetical protein
MAIWKCNSVACAALVVFVVQDMAAAQSPLKRITVTPEHGFGVEPIVGWTSIGLCVTENDGVYCYAIEEAEGDRTTVTRKKISSYSEKQSRLFSSGSFPRQHGEYFGIAFHGSAQVWNVSGEKLFQVLKKETDGSSVFLEVCDPSEHIVLSRYSDLRKGLELSRFWQSGKVAKVRFIADADHSCMHSSTNGKLCAIGLRFDAGVSIIDSDSLQEVVRLPDCGGFVSDVRFAADDATLFVARSSGIRIFDTHTWKEKCRWSSGAEGEWITGVDAGVDGRVAYVTVSANRIQRLPARVEKLLIAGDQVQSTGKPVWHLDGLTPKPVRVSPGGEWVASVAFGGPGEISFIRPSAFDKPKYSPRGLE